MDGNDIAKGLNDTLNQHYFDVEYVENTGSEYAGIATGKFSTLCLILRLKYNQYLEIFNPCHVIFSFRNV